jgi:hypothetical protein
LYDDKTLNLFRELSADGGSLDTLGSSCAKEIALSDKECPEELNYDAQYLINSEEEIKKTALKIMLQKELEISHLVIERAKEELKTYGKQRVSEGLVLLAYKIIKDHATTARLNLMKKEESARLSIPAATPIAILHMD